MELFPDKNKQGSLLIEREKTHIIAGNRCGVSRLGGSFHHPMEGLAGRKLMTPRDTGLTVNRAEGAVRA